MKDIIELIPGKYAAERAVRKFVMEVVTNLPRRQREAVILYYYDDLDITEVAWAMSISYPKVSKYLAQARKKLISEIEKKQLSEGFGSMAREPANSLIPRVLQTESEEFIPDDPVWKKRVLEQCRQYILSDSHESSVQTPFR